MKMPKYALVALSMTSLAGCVVYDDHPARRNVVYDAPRGHYYDDGRHQHFCPPGHRKKNWC